VRANVVPAWNSRDAVYPAPTQYEQAISESPARRLHPLSAEDLGPAWIPWNLREVGGSSDARLRIEPLRSSSRAETPTFQLAMSPERTDGARRNGSNQERSILSVVLGVRARRLLDDRGQRLRVVYRATTGSRVNGITGTGESPVEFELEDRFGVAGSGRVLAELVGSIWGGVDGWTAPSCADLDDLGVEALIAGGTRSVADVSSILERCYGNELELVDERDLLRSSGSSVQRPLAVRVRSVRPERDARERRLVRRSCRHFLEHYLAATSHGGIELIDADPVVERAR
jgi:hypothetical protein